MRRRLRCSASSTGTDPDSTPPVASPPRSASYWLAVAEELWTLIRSSGKGMGRTKTSKLLARKRPRLLPVVDSVVRATLGHRNGRTDFYETLQQTLAADDEALHNRLLEIRQRSGVGDDISVLRCFDILVWMSGARPETTRRAIEDAGSNLRD